MVRSSPEGSGFASGDYTNVDTTYAMVNKASLYQGSAMTLKIVDADTAKSTADRLANSTLWLKLSTMKPLAFKGPKMEATGARMGGLHEPALRSIASRYAEIKSVQDIVAKAP